MKKKVAVVCLAAWLVGGSILGFLLGQYIHVANHDVDPDYPPEDDEQ